MKHQKNFRLCDDFKGYGKATPGYNGLNQSIYSLQITQKEHLLIWNSETTQSLNIYLFNYQTKTAIFLATKHEKTIMTCNLNFWKYFLHFKLLASNTIKIESIRLNSWHHSHKKQKIETRSLETRVVLLIFLLSSYREYIKTAKNVGFCERLLSENDFEAVLDNICCYDYGANACEAVQKIATDQKD